MPQIIPKNNLAVEGHWQKELSSSFSDPEKLLDFLEIDSTEFESGFAARKLFPMRVPRFFANLMQKGDAHDPLLLQVLTREEEFFSPDNYVVDPLDEQDSAMPGLLHKYQSRVLLIVRGGCAVNCRYCFRRHFPYQDNSPSKAQWLETLEYIANDKNISEVILSGGDPLMAKDSFLSWLSEQISAIPHITTLRIHTRLPVVLPNRIDEQFLDWFTNGRLKPIMILHINHAKEISLLLRQKLKQLQAKNVVLLNQAVLLKGINDDADSQSELNETLFHAGVMPYYLHMLDKVKGASHFDISQQEAVAIQQEVIKRQPGYMVPKLVREIGGQPGKTPVDLKLHP